MPDVGTKCHARESSNFSFHLTHSPLKGKDLLAHFILASVPSCGFTNRILLYFSDFCSKHTTFLCEFRSYFSYFHLMFLPLGSQHRIEWHFQCRVPRSNGSFLIS